MKNADEAQLIWEALEEANALANSANIKNIQNLTKDPNLTDDDRVEVERFLDDLIQQAGIKRTPIIMRAKQILAKLSNRSITSEDSNDDEDISNSVKKRKLDDLGIELQRNPHGDNDGERYYPTIDIRTQADQPIRPEMPGLGSQVYGDEMSMDELEAAIRRGFAAGYSLDS